MGTLTSFVDTVILVDHLNGVAPATELVLRPEPVSTSLISWMEVMVGIRSAKARKAVQDLFSIGSVVGITQEIAAEPVRIRQASRLKLPDAIILATARWMALPLQTRKYQGF